LDPQATNHTLPQPCHVTAAYNLLHPDKRLLQYEPALHLSFLQNQVTTNISMPLCQLQHPQQCPVLLLRLTPICSVMQQHRTQLSTKQQATANTPASLKRATLWQINQTITLPYC
jgi:hypothetical protein